MKKILLLSLLLSFWLHSFSQSETHDFITYDTVITTPVTGGGTGTWAIRISRPVNMFTPNHEDTASRPVFMFTPGQGEVIEYDGGADPGPLNQRYGPHYWLNNGWDGGVQLSNGTHYPILMTLLPKTQNIRPWHVKAILEILLNKFKIKRNSVHVGGLSMGGFMWSRAIVYAGSPGDESTMSMITSFLALQGVANDNFLGHNQPGWTAFGTWAKKYGGTFFGLEGTTDGRGVYNPRNAMEDSVAGSAYFSMENIGGGAHCCWNQMLDTSRRNWKNGRYDLGTNITWNTMSGRGNSMGTYQNGWNIFEWWLRQGDTTLVTGVVSMPVANAGADQTITASSATLNSSASSGTITSRTWSLLSGPNTPTIVNPNSVSTLVTGLVDGTYQFRISVTNSAGTATDDVTITKDPANIPPVVDAGADKTVTTPASSVVMTGSASDADGTVTTLWTQVSGPNTATITNPASVTTSITGLIVGVYTFRLTGTDNASAVVSDDVVVNVVNPTPVVSKNIQFRFYAPSFGAAIDTNSWNNWNSAGNNSFTATNIKYADGTYSTYGLSTTNFGMISNNGTSYTGFTMCPDLVGQQTSYYPGTRTLQFTGLDSTKTYHLELYCSRTNNQSTRFTIDTTHIVIAALNNKGNAANFNNLKPTAGVITLTIGPSAYSTQSYLNGGILTEVGDSIPANIPPVVNAGLDQTITSPTDSVLLNGTASDADGTVTTVWTQISGPNTATIANPTSVNTAVTGLVVGVYTFRLTGTDNNSAVVSDDVEVTVQNPAPIITKKIQFRFYNPSFGAVIDTSSWNNWNSTGNNSFTATNIKYSDGSYSSYGLSTTNFGMISSNGTSYTGFTMCPDLVGQQTSYYPGTRTLQFTGLDSTKTYNLELYCSRSNNQSTKFTIGSTDINIAALNNKSNAANFNNLSPVGGVITLTIGPSTSSTQSYLNGGTLTEVDTSTHSLSAPVVPGELSLTPLVTLSNTNAKQTVFPNPFVSELKLSYNSSSAGIVTVRIVNMSGQQEIVRKVAVQVGNNVLQLRDLEKLKVGIYLLEVISKEGKSSHKVSKM